jgi:ABC-type dipeptide/oligopeptide/nickel transport system permease subunit/cellulose synthase/poly-beta-1,6-N-acetylglucosamine synthase-like glycosyltransferase
MFLLILISLLLIAVYANLIGFYSKTWEKIPIFERKYLLTGSQIKITVIIAARNEEKNIGSCLQALAAQDYPSSLYQVIVVDDHSTDQTWNILTSLRFDKMNALFIPLREFTGQPQHSGSFKKFAIESAIAACQGDLILTTDADCRPGNQWLSVIADCYQQTGAKMIAAPVKIESGKSMITIFQTLDFITLQGITGAAVFRKVHSMCNGANLAFEKKVFVEVGGYRDIDDIPSGDDMFLMHKIFKQYPDGLFFLKNEAAIVSTKPESSWKGFFNQRIRWSSKADKYQEKNLFRVLLFVYAFNLLFPVLLFVAIWKPGLLILLAVLLILKTAIEFSFVRRVASFFGQQKLMAYFAFFQPLHIAYILIAGWLGKFGSYQWKDRKIERHFSHRSDSFYKNVWRRLRKNKGAVFGMFLIGLSLIIAITGYFITPDASPNANRMVVEIGGRRPGFTQEFLLLKKDQVTEHRSLLSRMLRGQEDAYRYIPINGFKQAKDSLIVRQYIDEDVEERAGYPITQAQMQSSGNEPPYAIQTKTFWLGTDQYGRDILSRLLIGVRVSLSVGIVTVIISLSIGVLLGALAGYYRGRTDDLIMWFINIIWSIPTLLLVFAITLVLGKGFWQIFIAIGLIQWVNTARIIRGQVLVVREMEYVQAARALGFSNFRILFRHVLPNVMGPIMVVAASNFASAIIIEAGLSFLGVGVQPPQPSWGLMIKENYNFIITHNPMLALAPGLAIMVLVLAFNLLGNGLRDAMDVRG